MRLIDADKVPTLSDIRGCAYEGGEYQAYKSGAEYGRGLVDDTPTIDPESVRPTAHWISVKDKLPVAKDVVLAYESAFDSMSMAFRLPGTEVFINVGDYYALDAVTHWMPLPEPPEVTP